MAGLSRAWQPGLAIAAGLAFQCSSDEGPTREERLAACEQHPLETYEQRILPLLSDQDPKSCNQCHLSGVDLGAFVRSTPCESMACLVEQGLVDLETPDQSKILAWIQRATPESELITQEVIDAEYTGVLEWIEASAECPAECEGVACGSIVDGPRCPTSDPHTEVSEEPVTPTTPPAEVGCDDKSIEQLFYDDVYAWRGRCFPCHYSDQLYAEAAAPRWLRVEGTCESGSLETLRVLQAGDYFDLEDPTQSLLLLKPLSKDAGGVTHGGGEKFADQSDPAYVSFLAFIEHYAECRR